MAERLLKKKPRKVVQVELEAVYEAPENPCSHRHEYGVGEKVKFTVTLSLSGALMQVAKADSHDMTTADPFEP